MKTFNQFITEATSDILISDYGAIITSDGNYARVEFNYQHAKVIKQFNYLNHKDFFSSGGIRLIYDSGAIENTIGIEFNIDDITENALDALIKTVKTLQRKFKERVTYSLSFNRYDQSDKILNLVNKLHLTTYGNKFNYLNELLLVLDKLSIMLKKNQ